MLAIRQACVFKFGAHRGRGTGQAPHNGRASLPTPMLPFRKMSLGLQLEGCVRGQMLRTSWQRMRRSFVCGRQFLLTAGFAEAA